MEQKQDPKPKSYEAFKFALWIVSYVVLCIQITRGDNNMVANSNCYPYTNWPRILA